VRWWKWLGLAGLAGVTATGVVVARSERRRRGYTPEEVRQRLHERLAEVSPGESDPALSFTAASSDGHRPRHRLRSGRIKLRNRLRPDAP
jgi:hypothetical protein